VPPVDGTRARAGEALSALDQRAVVRTLIGAVYAIKSI
jgi:hypothetical protein